MYVVRPVIPGSNLYTSLSLLWMYVNTLYVPVHVCGPPAEPALHFQPALSPAPPQVLYGRSYSHLQPSMIAPSTVTL